MIKIGSIGYRMEIRFIKIDQKYASNNNGTITAQFDYNMVYVSVELMQGMLNEKIKTFEKYSK